MLVNGEDRKFGCIEGLWGVVGSVYSDASVGGPGEDSSGGCSFLLFSGSEHLSSSGSSIAWLWWLITLSAGAEEPVNIIDSSSATTVRASVRRGKIYYYLTRRNTLAFYLLEYKNYLLKVAWL
jgi:hypothetical protein